MRHVTKWGYYTERFYLNNRDLWGVSNQNYTLLESSYFQRFFVASEPSIFISSDVKCRSFGGAKVITQQDSDF